MIERPNEKAVEAAAKAKRPGFWVITPEMETTVQEVFGPILEAAAPHIIEQYEAEQQSGMSMVYKGEHGLFRVVNGHVLPAQYGGSCLLCRPTPEQFIDGLTDGDCIEVADSTKAIYLRACAALEHDGVGENEGAREFRRQLKGLIP